MEEFEDNIEKLQEKNISDITNLIFRGQSNTKWGLKTSLDRIEEKISCDDYISILKRVKSNIESFTGNLYNLRYKSNIPFANQLTGEQNDLFLFTAYLRHHLFPSPLLDWTISPYIACFFAFSEIGSKNDVAVFTFLALNEYTKGGCEDSPEIRTISPKIRTHKRHYLQQSVYTICTKKVNEKYHFGNHEEVFTENDGHQDLLIKYTIPISERQKALNRLDLMNINEYSLFQNEESLLKTLASKEFFIKRQPNS